MPRYRNIDEHYRALTNARTLTNVVKRSRALSSVSDVNERYRDALAKTIRT